MFTGVAMRRVILILSSVLFFGCNNFDNLEESCYISLAQEKWEKTITCFNKLMLKSPNNEEYRLALAKAYYNSGYLYVAIKHLNQALDVNDTYNDAYMMYKDLYEKETNKINIQNLIDKVLSASFENVGFIYNLAEISYQKGDFETAKNLLKKIITIDPDNEDVACELATIIYDKGNINEAIEFLKKYLSDNSTSACVHHLLALAYLEQGIERAKAVEHISYALDYYAQMPDIDFSKRKQKIIEEIRPVDSNLAEEIIKKYK